MILKPYQQQVIDDLGVFLNHLKTTQNVGEAYTLFWEQHPRTKVHPRLGTAVEPYKNNIVGVPHICIKVPTAGGKTYIACNALKPIFDAFEVGSGVKAVVWLVPSVTILEQTLKNLRDVGHPYRQQLQAHFQGRVEVYNKQEILMGANFNKSTVAENLSIIVMSFDSLRARNKDDRKMYDELNGNLTSFGDDTEGSIGTSAMSVLQSLNPVVVVDESHNAETDLSKEMLSNLNPCFILDLTATPRKNSNIITFIDALSLKTENMVKLPVIVRNCSTREEVIEEALNLRCQLELQAEHERANGGKYIRPIVLFQAEPKGNDDSQTFKKLKDLLIQKGLPEAHIKIKTANINELKNVDLMSEDNEVRYIITVNALKEGWDCPFAYILASIQNKSSAVDVEQILGRVLRQPHVQQHKADMLNYSYVLTSSDKFLDTVGNVVKALNKSGFSSSEYRLAETKPVEPTPETPTSTTETPPKDPSVSTPFGTSFGQNLSLFGTSETELTAETTAETTTESTPESAETSATVDTSTMETLDLSNIQLPTATTTTTAFEAIQQQAAEANAALQNIIESTNQAPNSIIPQALQGTVKQYPIRDVFHAEAVTIKLPQYFIEVPGTGGFFAKDEDVLFHADELLKYFKLSQEEIKISWNDILADLYRVDLDETDKDHRPKRFQISGRQKETLLNFFLDPTRQHRRVKDAAEIVIRSIGSQYPIPDSELRKYIENIFGTFKDEQFKDFINNQYAYAQKIKKKIEEVKVDFAEKEFRKGLDTDRIKLKPNYVFPPTISPTKLAASSIIKSLYQEEGELNTWEEKVIEAVSQLDNIRFWTRNGERKHFCINGFVNHYPDFIAVTKSGKILAIEPKGDHLANAESTAKIRLGRAWAKSNYKYFMVFDKKEVDGAYRLDAFLEMVKQL